MQTCVQKNSRKAFGFGTERTYDNVIASHNRQGKIKIWGWWKILNQEMPRTLPGVSGGELPARWKKEEKNRKERRKARRRREINDVIRGIIAVVPKEADTVGGGVTRIVSAAICTNAGEDSFEKSELGVGRML